MKKLYCSILVITLVCSLLNGCTGNTSASNNEKSMAFSSNTELLEYAQSGYWISEPQYSDTSHYKICCFKDKTCIKFDLSRSSDRTLTDMFYQMLLELQQSGHEINYEDVYSFLAAVPKVQGLEFTILDVEYNFSESNITNSETSSAWKFQNNGSMNHHGDSYVLSQDLSILQNSFEQAYYILKETEKEEFLSNYPDLVSYIDVKYDPYSYLGRSFTITGVAELDDYFNYEYRDMEYVYFCISIEPINGSYSDRWYIYADRNSFQELFQTLKNSPISDITLVCKSQFIDATTNSLATLVDYYIS